MKRTPEDNAFLLIFSQQLQLKYEKATKSKPGMSDEDFASTLDVSRAALKKYLAGSAMPTLRTVVLAYQRHGIAVPYFGTTLFLRSRSKGKALSPSQLILPFSVRALNADVVARIEPVSTNAFELRVNVERTR